MPLDIFETWNTDKPNGEVPELDQEYDKVLPLSVSERSELELLLEELADLIEAEDGIVIL